MKAVVAAFNQEKALVGAFSVITNLRMELFEALASTQHRLSLSRVRVASPQRQRLAVHRSPHMNPPELLQLAAAWPKLKSSVAPWSRPEPSGAAWQLLARQRTERTNIRLSMITTVCSYLLAARRECVLL